MTADIRSLGKTGHVFTNWAKTYFCHPELYFEPESVQEIQQILAFGREKGKKVKIVGNGHSPSDLACTTDYMISLKRFNQLIKVNKEKLRVTVQGGCLLKDLNDTILPASGMALSVLGTVSDLTVAGVISTGTHGTGHNFGILSSYVVDLDLMIASGEIIHISADDNSDLFQAAVLSLGSLGVILSVTLQCEPAFNLSQIQYPAKLKDVIENLNIYLTAGDHFRFFWFPYTDGVICYSASRSKEPPKVKSSWFWDMLIGFHLLQFLYWTSTFIPSLVRLINQLYYRILYAHRTERVERSDHIFGFNCLFHQYVMEWAIPRESLGVVLLQLGAWIEENHFPAHFPVEVRFVKGDNIFLSPAYNQDSCYINIIMYRPYDKFVSNSKYWEAFENIVASVGGRPHWAKDHDYTGEQFSILYPKWNEFCSIREKLDPTGMFLNASLERIFGKFATKPVSTLV